MTTAFPENSADEDAWTIAESQLGDRQLLIRFRPNLATFEGRTNFPMKLTARWTYGDDGDSGMPNQEQSDAMQVLEDDLVPELEINNTAILAYIYTSQGMREWHIYFSDLEQLQNALNRATAGKPGLPLEMDAAEDPHWEEILGLIANCQG